MIAGRRVIDHTLAALLACPEIEHVVVNVQHDDAHIDETATAFPNVTFLRNAGATPVETANALQAMGKRVKRDAGCSCMMRRGPVYWRVMWRAWLRVRRRIQWAACWPHP